jgi:hypothetical protein
MGLVLHSDHEQYFDVVDTTDPNLLITEARELSSNSPILLNKCNGDAVTQMVRTLLSRVRSGGRPIGFLAIHGHGLPGIQSIAGGVPPTARTLSAVLTQITPRSRNVLAAQNADAIAPTLRMLTGHFTKDARVFLMGCYVGQGCEGWRLLKALASIWQVSVSAGTELQLAGGLTTSFIEGPIRTATP